VIGPPQVIAEATCCAELVDAFRARKEALGLSNEAVEHLIPLAAGHCDKVIGLSGTRGLSQLTIDGLLSSLGLRLLIAIDPAAVARMAPRWANEGRRDAKQVRTSTSRIAKAMIARARPVVLRDLGRRAGQARWRGIDPKLRSRLMSELARLRWDASRVASRPEPSETAQ
jgi:hypothetical protein